MPPWPVWLVSRARASLLSPLRRPLRQRYASHLKSIADVFGRIHPGLFDLACPSPHEQSAGVGPSHLGLLARERRFVSNTLLPIRLKLENNPDRQLGLLKITGAEDLAEVRRRG
jgi:hypothetical protein